MRQHKSLSHEAVRYNCEHCAHKTGTIWNLRNHIKKVHKNFKCYKCNFITLNQADIKGHIVETHGGYECDICGVKTETFGKLNHHNLMHDEPRFSCDQCDYKAKRNGHLKEHKQVHHERSQFPCDIPVKKESKNSY